MSFVIIFGTLSFSIDVDVQTVVVLDKWNDDGVRRRHDDLIGCVPWKFPLESMRLEL